MTKPAPVSTARKKRTPRARTGPSADLLPLEGFHSLPEPGLDLVAAFRSPLATLQAAVRHVTNVVPASRVETYLISVVDDRGQLVADDGHQYATAEFDTECLVVGSTLMPARSCKALLHLPADDQIVVEVSRTDGSVQVRYATTSDARVVREVADAADSRIAPLEGDWQEHDVGPLADALKNGPPAVLGQHVPRRLVSAMGRILARADTVSVMTTLDRIIVAGVGGLAVGWPKAPATASGPDPCFVWREKLRSVLRLCDKPAKLTQEILAGIENRAWTGLLDPWGKRFRSFTGFCEAPEPYGLGTPVGEVESLLRQLTSAKTVQLIAAAPSRQGERTDLGATSCPEGTKCGTRQDKRYRAIERAGEPVVALWKQGLLTAKEAAAFGKQNLTDAEVERVAEFMRWAAQILATVEDGSEVPNGVRTEVKQAVAVVFPPPDPVDQLLRSVEKLSSTDQTRFWRRQAAVASPAVAIPGTSEDFAPMGGLSASAGPPLKPQTDRTAAPGAGGSLNLLVFFVIALRECLEDFASLERWQWEDLVALVHKAKQEDWTKKRLAAATGAYVQQAPMALRLIAVAEQCSAIDDGHPSEAALRELAEEADALHADISAVVSVEDVVRIEHTLQELLAAGGDE